MASIASVYVDILPSTGKIADGIAKALRESDDDVKRAAKRWARDIEKELGSPTVDIDADTKAAEKKIERLEKDKHTTHVDVDVDAAKAEAELDAVTCDRTVKIDVDKSLWSGGFKHLGAEGIPGCAGGMASAGSEFASAGATAGTSMGAGMGKALIPALIAAAIPAADALGGVAASAAQSLLLIPAAAGAAGLAIGTLTLATQGVRRCARRRGRSVPSGFRHELAEQAGKEPRPPTMSAGGGKGSDSVTWACRDDQRHQWLGGHPHRHQ
jgi:flagellar hook-basal body complex protein FliE